MGHWDSFPFHSVRSKYATTGKYIGNYTLYFWHPKHACRNRIQFVLVLQHPQHLKMLVLAPSFWQFLRHCWMKNGKIAYFGEKEA